MKNPIRAFKDWVGKNNKNNRLERIEMKLSELATQLNGIDTKLTEASTEILKLIEDLRKQLGDVDIPVEAETTLASLSAKANALADIVPNA